MTAGGERWKMSEPKPVHTIVRVKGLSKAKIEELTRVIESMGIIVYTADDARSATKSGIIIESAPGTAVDLSEFITPESIAEYEEAVMVMVKAAKTDRYCCDTMRGAVEAELIQSFDKLTIISQETDSLLVPSPNYWPINYCPFCGTAVTPSEQSP